MYKTFTVGAIITAYSAFVQGNNSSEPRINMPWKKMGLTQKEAAAHLLGRFSFGARPGEIEEVVQMGLEKWLQQQLNGKLPDEELARRLTGYDALAMNNETITNTYLTAGQIVRMAVKNNLIDKDSIKNGDKKDYREAVKKLMEEGGYKAPQKLQRQLINQKIIRAAYGQNQVQEILTDFWFNHFNVSLTKPQCQQFILTYERDAIRPNVSGNFGTLLEATAKHPAMLEYLDNASSVSNDNAMSKKPVNKLIAQRLEKRMEAMEGDTSQSARFLTQTLKARKIQGLNENYAREIMELHTLGVDGGYTQKDVTEVARALTGWGLVPLYKDGPAKKLINNATPAMLEKRGYQVQGDFLYRADKHDDGEKLILGKKFPSNGGYEEGMEVLQLLSTHPATAKFICKKIATRFVSDNPSEALVNRMAESFLQSNGNIKTVLVTMVNSTGFWDKNALREKVKSPFEFAISAIRATNADVQQPFQIFNWCMKMGQRFYFYQAPTGFPDKAAYWINTGSLLNRMNFGLAFASEKIPGVKLNLVALNNNHEPESADAALVVYSKLLLPERNQEENIKRLTALVHDVNLEQKINEAATKAPVAVTVADMNGDDMMMNVDTQKKNKQNQKGALNKKNTPVTMVYAKGNNSTVSQVAGIIIGSPEFQRK